MMQFSQTVNHDGTKFGVVKNTMPCGCIDVHQLRFVSDTFPLQGEEWDSFQKTLEYLGEKRRKSFQHGHVQKQSTDGVIA